ncbi:MAG: type III-B CRISPR-associated protein Cas10/Cmr2 [Coleofasciculus chthonoplastes F3-SA18-01]|uniref:type III-B CRISPR-associated protein Cas10/Cmr2 n=1 Tax=Coleofasciculus chthonoplastes TaxID=64178 RepID=UPI0033004830
MTHSLHPLTIGIAWCLAWGEGREPQFDLSIPQMREALLQGKDVSEIEALKCSLQTEGLDFPQTLDELQQLTEQYPTVWDSKIGLVYGGATKIKQYVFESAKLPEIRGASALLDRINLIDLPAFFKCEQLPEDFPECYRARKYCQKVRRELQHQDQKLQQLWEALVPELVIYSTGGNILAFCPTAFVPDLVNLIEKRYTEETLTANSCAVGESFRLLELRFGLLDNPIEQTKWLDWYLQDNKRQTNPITSAYFGQLKNGQPWKYLFENRKNFNEITGKLAALFQQRRNGNNLPDSQRPSRRYPPMFETHPYLLRDDVEHRLAIAPGSRIPDEPWFSDALARKRIVGQRTKGEGSRSQKWWTENSDWKWQLGQVKTLWNSGYLESWVVKFRRFIEKSHYRDHYYKDIAKQKIGEARSLTEISNAGNGFVGYIYADGNNIGGYIQKELKTPQDCRRFSRDIFTATEESVYHALGRHLKPHQLNGLTGDNQHRNGAIIYPFEILTIGGDDVMLIVPADKALVIAQTIGEEFERILLEGEKIQGKEDYRITDSEIISRSQDCHRYQGQIPVKPSQCKLSMSTGVLITAYQTPIYYAENLTNQLLKSAKKKAKQLKKDYDYHGGTVDFLTLKSVTMISSNIEAFRQEALTKQEKGKPKLKLYGAPYTLHELGGLIKTGEKLKQSEFPRSQLYQIRSLLERGKQTAILNYRYFRVRLKPENQKLLADYFEKAWCNAKTNNGNLAPWMSLLEKDGTTTYETIWRELVELYPFIVETTEQPSQTEARLL